MKKLLAPFMVSLASLAAANAYAAYGDVDPAYHSFAGGCTVIEPREDGSAYVQAAGPYPSTSITIARLTPQGDPDTSWGTNGSTTYQALELNRAMQILRGSDGDIFVVDGGYAGRQNGITHFTADGRVDASFGNGGRLVIPWSLGAALQPDGKIAVLAVENQGSVSMFRYTARGEPDPTFGRGGVMYLPGVAQSPFVYGPTIVYGWSIRSDGAVEVASYAIDATYAHITPALTTFGGDVFTPRNEPGRLVPQGIATWMSPLAKVEPTGALMLAAIGGLRRYTPDGYEDPAFSRTNTFGLYTVNALWREPDGAWTVVGNGQWNIGFIIINENYLRALRIRADGTREPGFRQFGSVRGTGEPVAHTADGKVLYAGTGCSLGRYLTDSPRMESTVVEYYAPSLDHYFLTSSANEISGLDANPLGWVRTGRIFGGWAPSDLAGSVRVCRFYGDPVIGPNSHFYTGQDFECQGLIDLAANAPPGVPAWHLEGKPLSLAIPSGQSCPTNLAPVYRVFNGPAMGPSGPNHRYTTDEALYQEMLSKGWLAEGVHFCAPPPLS